MTTVPWSRFFSLQNIIFLMIKFREIVRNYKRKLIKITLIYSVYKKIKRYVRICKLDNVIKTDISYYFSFCFYFFERGKKCQTHLYYVFLHNITTYFLILFQVTTKDLILLYFQKRQIFGLLTWLLLGKSIFLFII